MTALRAIVSGRRPPSPTILQTAAVQVGSRSVTCGNAKRAYCRWRRPGIYAGPGVQRHGSVVAEDTGGAAGSTHGHKMAARGI
jgi:hypothetical protein